MVQAVEDKNLAKLETSHNTSENLVSFIATGQHVHQREEQVHGHAHQGDSRRGGRDSGLPSSA